MMKRIGVIATIVALAALSSAVVAAPDRLTVRGDPAEMGRQIGRAYAEQIQRFHPQFLAMAQHQTGLSQQQLYAGAATLARSLHADDVAEMRGTAEGAGLEYEDLLFLNCYYTLTGGQVACRQLVVWGDRAEGGRLMHARNLDWPDYRGDVLQRNHLIVNYSPGEGHGLEHLLLTWPGLIAAIEGTNRAGLTLAFNQLARTERSASMLTEPTFFTIRRALRTCSTIDEAVDVIRKARPRDNGSIMVSDATRGAAVVVEVVDGEIGVRDAGERAMIGNANHATRESSVRNAPRYGDADAPACRVALRTAGPISLRRVQQVMRDPAVLQSTNLRSVVFVPAINRMYLASGPAPAARGPFIEYKLFDDEDQ